VTPAYRLPPTLVKIERCRWCHAPGKVVDLELVNGPRLVAIVCTDRIACIKRQGLKKGRIELGDARRHAHDRRRTARRLERARR
jgi:hypothetical protein